MTLSYNWNLTGITKQNIADPISANDVVVHVRWEYTGTDAANNTGTFTGATPLDVTVLQANNFIPYEQLTQNTVIGWVKNIVTNDTLYMSHINDRIQEQIDSIISPKTEVSANDFPWIETSNTAANTVVSNTAANTVVSAKKPISK